MHERDLYAEARERHLPLKEAAAALEKASSASEDNRLELISAELSGLSLALSDHIRLTEGPDGLHAELISTQPRLTNDIRLLTKDHDVMECLIEATSVALESETPDESTISDQVGRLLERIERHRLRDAEMVYEAYAVDIGGQA